MSFWLQACFQLWTAPACVPTPLSVEESTVCQYVHCNAVFIRNESLFVVSAAATSAFELKHTPRLLGSIHVCPAGYQIRTIEYGKILVMLLYGKYYWHVYEVYNKYTYTCAACQAPRLSPHTKLRKRRTW